MSQRKNIHFTKKFCDVTIIYILFKSLKMLHVPFHATFHFKLLISSIFKLNSEYCRVHIINFLY